MAGYGTASTPSIPSRGRPPSVSSAPAAGRVGAAPQILDMGSTLGVVLARVLLTGTGAPAAIEGKAIEKMIEQDLRVVFCRQPHQAIAATSATEVASDPHHHYHHLRVFRKAGAQVEHAHAGIVQQGRVGPATEASIGRGLRSSFQI